MGTRGPAPARSDQRRRRNKPETPTDKVEMSGEVEIPAPGEWHETALGWYRSLQESGQSRFFEPSDWQAAHFTATLMSKCLTGDVSSPMVAQVRGMMTDLLTTESARRRVGIELERKVAEGDKPARPSSVARLDERRKRLTDAS